MSKCGNCGSKITCGCQRATATDGKAVCKNCIGAYNKQILNQSSVAQKQINMVESKIVTEGPSQVTATYTGPGRQIL